MLGAGSDQQLGVGADPDDDQDQIHVPADLLAGRVDTLDPQPRAAAGTGLDPLHGGGGVDGDAAPGELGVDQCAELGVDRGQHLGQHLDLGDRDAPAGQGLRHLQTYVAGADDQGRPRRLVGQAAVQGQGCRPWCG